MSLFATLLLGHLLGDFLLQTNRVFELKSRSWVGVALHTAIHLVVTALLLQNWFVLWKLFVLLGLLHFSIDWVKVRYTSRSQTFDFMVDQIAHLVVIILFTLYWGPIALPILPLDILMLSIYYALLPAIGIFVWVMTIELDIKGYGHLQPIGWTKSHLLHLSQYAGIPLLIFLAYLLITFAAQDKFNIFYVSVEIEGRAEVNMRPFNRTFDGWRWQHRGEQSVIYMSTDEQLITQEGEATMHYFGGQETEVFSDTRVKILQLEEKAEETLTKIFIDSGKIFNTVHHTSNHPSQFHVLSPSSQASTLGTKFLVEVLSPEHTMYETHKGALRVELDSKTIELPEGCAVEAKIGEQPIVEQTKESDGIFCRREQVLQPNPTMHGQPVHPVLLENFDI